VVAAAAVVMLSRELNIAIPSMLEVIMNAVVLTASAAIVESLRTCG